MANILQIQIEEFCRARGCAPGELKASEFIDLNPIFDEPFKNKIPDLIAGFDWGVHEHLTHIGYYDDLYGNED